MKVSQKVPKSKHPKQHKNEPLSTEGDTSGGESLLINFDKVYEDFIKKVLMEYSSFGKVTLDRRKSICVLFRYGYVF